MIWKHTALACDIDEEEDLALQVTQRLRPFGVINLSISMMIISINPRLGRRERQ